MSEIKILKINFTDFWEGNPDFPKLITGILESADVKVEISDEPDFLFYSTFGTKHLTYDCVKIFFTGEDAVPDFNLCDYAIGFAPLSFKDRYVRVPLYCFYDKDCVAALDKHNNIDESYADRKFCNFVYSNPNATQEREQIFDLLSKYKKVDSGGRYRNNIGNPVDDKLKFQKAYKFSIAFENSASDGYTTEKILQAFAAKTIPIYWGNPNVAEDFNTEAFINCQDYSSIDEVVQKVKELDTDSQKYLNMLKTPMLKDDILIDKKRKEFDDFIIHVCSQSPEKARRRGTGTWNVYYNKHLNEMQRNEEFIKRMRKHFLGKVLLKLFR